MKEWFSPVELSRLQLPGLQMSDRGIRDLADREHWKALPNGSRKASRRGGGYEFHISVLPKSAREELEERARRASASQALTVAADTQRRQIDNLLATSLTARQRQVMEARAAILLELDRRILIGGLSRNAAVAEFILQTKLGELSGDIAAPLAIVAGTRQQLSRASIYNWLALREKGGVAALAPKLSKKREPLPDWFSEFFPFYARPGKTTISRALLNWQREQPGKTDFPSYRQVRIALDKLGTVERMKGRMGPQAIKALMAYKSRDTSDLLPTSVYAADGKTFDAEIAHPAHGQPFRPEMTTIIDVHTRKIVGWSVALAENTHATLDALRMACCWNGLPGTFYTDRGSGYKNKAWDAPLTGFLARLDITPMRALPYNSQAKGIVERVNRLWTEVARDLPTYINRDMDREHGNRVHKQTRKDIALVGTSRLLPSWQQFLAIIGREIDDYNNRPHSSLPRCSDPETGRQRFMTPNEMWQAAVDRGFAPVVVSEEEAADLFRPWEIRTVRRCLVSIYNNSYFAIELEEHLKNLHAFGRSAMNYRCDEEFCRCRNSQLFRALLPR